MSRRNLLAAGAIALLVISTYCFFTSKERQVRRVFRSLSSETSKEGQEGQLAAAQKAKAISEKFEEQCEWEAEGYHLSGSVGRENILQFAFAARGRFERLALDFYDIEAVFPESGVATVTATARLSGDSTAGKALGETHEVECELAKGKEGWLFRKVKLVQVLQK